MEESKYSCKKCNYYTNLLSSYNTHLKTELHENGKRKTRSDKIIMEPFTCEKCNYQNMNKLNFRMHMLNNHLSIAEKEKEFLFYCKICNFGCFAEICYKKHVETNKHKIKSL